jgi:hypothetical protein
MDLRLRFERSFAREYGAHFPKTRHGAYFHAHSHAHLHCAPLPFK